MALPANGLGATLPETRRGVPRQGRRQHGGAAHVRRPAAVHAARDRLQRRGSAVAAAGGARGGRVPSHRGARAGRHRAPDRVRSAPLRPGRRRQGDGLASSGARSGCARSTWGRSPTPDRWKASRRCSPRSTGATSSRTPASRSRASEDRSGAAFRRATRRARDRSPPGRAPARRDRGGRSRGAPARDRRRLATAALSSVTCAKSRWLASATARITSVNLAARSSAGAAVHHALERRQLRDVVEARQHDQRDRGPRDRPRAPRRLGERRGRRRGGPRGIST